MKISVFFNNLWEYVVNHSREFFSTLIVILICVLVIIIGYIVAKKYTSKKSTKKYANELANKLFYFYRFIVCFIGVLIICSSWGIKLTAVLIGFAILLIGLSIGAKDVIADIISGLIITFSDYYDIDDYVCINGFKGFVKEVRLKTTKLINLKNEVRIIANSTIKEITNYSKNPFVNQFEIEFDKKENIEKVISILEDNLGNVNENIDGIIEGPNIIGLTDINNDGYVIKVVIKSKIDENNLVISGVKKYTKEILEFNNISFKFYKKD